MEETWGAGQTPRDLKRVIGSFESLYSILVDEVNWIDILGYSTLLTKTPRIADLVRNDPIFFTEDFERGGAAMHRYGYSSPSTDEQLETLLGADFSVSPEIGLFRFLFPRFSARTQYRADSDYSRITNYRALSFLMRLGVPPGTITGDEVRALFELDAGQLAERFDSMVEQGRFDDLNYYLSYHYGNLGGVDHSRFWVSAAVWCKKPDSQILTSHDPRVGYLEILQSSFSSALARNTELSGLALDIVRSANQSGAFEFAEEVLRNQIFAHGLFGRQQRHERVVIGSPREWEDICLKIGEDWRNRFLNSDWFFESWKESAVWFLRDAGLWNEECKQRLIELTEPEQSFNAFLIMLFGRHYSVDRSGVEILMDWDVFVEKMGRLGNNLNGEHITNDIRAAYEKASGRTGTNLAQ